MCGTSLFIIFSHLTCHTTTSSHWSELKLKDLLLKIWWFHCLLQIVIKQESQWIFRIEKLSIDHKVMWTLEQICQNEFQRNHIEGLTYKCKGVGARVVMNVLERESSHRANIYEQMYNFRTKGVEADVPSTESMFDSQDIFVIFEEILILQVPHSIWTNFSPRSRKVPRMTCV